MPTDTRGLRVVKMPPVVQRPVRAPTPTPQPKRRHDDRDGGNDMLDSLVTATIVEDVVETLFDIGSDDRRMEMPSDPEPFEGGGGDFGGGGASGDWDG